MALLDVTEILLATDFMGAGVIWKRSAQTVGDNGRATSVVTTTPFAGVVTNDKDEVLERLAGGECKKGSITIHTMLRLTAGGGDRIADIVTWQGRDCTVANVNDYSHISRGFAAASGDLLPLAG